MKKINIFGKELSVLLVVGLVMAVGASATLVGYLSNTISEEVTVSSPIELIGDYFELDIEVAGDDGFALIKLTNKAGVDIVGDLEIVIGPDSEGVNIAFTEDINYCFSTQGDMTGVADCETDYMNWMANNIDWNDWYANDAYNDGVYPSSLVVDTDSDSFHGIGYTGNKLILPDLTFPGDTTVYGVVYVATSPAL